MAASLTVRHMGPAVSWRGEIGTMPWPLTAPTVGLRPTRPLSDAGDRMEPLVSEPMAAAQKLAAAATPEPALEPDGLRSRAYAFRVWPPTALQPLEDRVERKFAHSLRFDLPSTIAPAARSRPTSGASVARSDRASARDPAVVAIGSDVSMLSLTIMGTPCSGPRSFLALRSASSTRAMARAFGLSARTDRYSGPWWSKRAMRAKYAAVRPSDVMAPDARACCNEALACSLGAKARSVAAARSSRAAARDRAPATLMKRLRSMTPPLMRSRHRIAAPAAQTVPGDLRCIAVSLILDYRCCGPKIQHRGWKFEGVSYGCQNRVPPSVARLSRPGLIDRMGDLRAGPGKA